ncbi:ATP-dependent DNA helicase PcrA, partial [Streptococcus suis]
QAMQSRKASVQPSAKLGGSMPFASGNKSTSSGTNWSVGDNAVHKKWGRGTVLEVSGSGSNQELKINLPEMGLKKVLASLSPISKEE